MPKLEPKVIQRELDQGQIWPVYWVYGSEQMKARELLKRIRKAIFPEGESQGAALLGMAEETFEGGHTSADAVLDAALSPALGGGIRLVIVRDAHALKEPERLAELLGQRSTRDKLPSVCVFLSKDIDARKKFSKMLLEKAAVVPCEEVAEGEREAWIGYLAKRRNVTLPPGLVAQLATLDPWSLDIIDQELEKYSLALEGGGGDAAEVVLSGVALQGGADAFMNAFFARDLRSALERVETFADAPEEALPLLGLLAWNVRQLALFLADRENGTRHFKVNPYLAQKFQVWGKSWRLAEIIELQKELAELDFQFKQTPLLPLGMWAKIVSRFASPS